jgi:hypothetical protein
VLRDFSIQTKQHPAFVDIRRQVHREITCSRIAQGICLVFSPHTSAAITITENADPDVITMCEFDRARNRSVRVLGKPEMPEMLQPVGTSPGGAS